MAENPIGSSNMNDCLPFDALLANPVITLGRAGRIVLVALLLGLFIPGFASYQLKTFFVDDTIEKLPSKAKENIKAFDYETKQLRETLTQIEQKIARLSSIENADALAHILELRRGIEQYIEKRNPPIRIAPFYLGSFMLVFQLFYVSFFWLIFLFSPRTRYIKSAWAYTLMFLGLEFIYRWPTWIRNTPPLLNSNRIVYAGTNIDVDIASFVLQEFNAIIVVFCMLELFIRWSNYFVRWKKEIIVFRAIKLPTDDQKRDFLGCLIRQFIHWQVSVLLAVAFLPYTYFFWRYVVDFWDMRYLAHAVITHFLWGVSWVVISLPLTQTWYDWQLKQAMSLSQVQERGETDEKVEGQKFPDSPIGSLNFIASIVVAILTFGSPLIKAVASVH